MKLRIKIHYGFLFVPADVQDGFKVILLLLDNAASNQLQ